MKLCFLQTSSPEKLPSGHAVKIPNTVSSASRSMFTDIITSFWADRTELQQKIGAFTLFQKLSWFRRMVAHSTAVSFPQTILNFIRPSDHILFSSVLTICTWHGSTKYISIGTFYFNSEVARKWMCVGHPNHCFCQPVQTDAVLCTGCCRLSSVHSKRFVNIPRYLTNLKTALFKNSNHIPLQQRKIAIKICLVLPN